MEERTFALAADFCARSLNVRYDGMAIASRMPMMMTTTRSSMSVKPDSSFARRLLMRSLTVFLLPERLVTSGGDAVIGGTRTVGHPPNGLSARPEAGLLRTGKGRVPRCR